MDYEKYRSLFRGEDMPLCYLDLDLLDKNIDAITKQMEGTNKTIRLASKSLRVPSMIEHILKHDNIEGILAYSATEAVFLSQQGIDDIIIAYPVMNENYIRQVLLEKKRIYFMVDLKEHVDQIATVAKELETTARLCIDIDMTSRYPGVYFGVYRSSIKSADQVRVLGEYILQSKHVKLEAIMGYEAQIAGVADRSPARSFILNAVVRLLKTRSIASVARFRGETIRILKEQGHPITIVNGGGTGSVKSTKEEEGVTEVTVGSGFFSPALFDYYNDFRYAPAMGFAIEVTRKPEDNVYTCHGGGYIASGSIGIDKQPEIFMPAEASFFADEGCGEVQTPIKYKGKLKLGDPVLLRHAKAGELAEHFNEVLILKDGKIIDRVKTYRGLGKKFL
ncbi:MAG: alanine racemase [Candidatus Heimdallarchaeota archaeon]|nr:alanine racemase [Candidatus Heimdallarchaeota archaeon]